ncbi:MAG: hypothetical protein JXR97_07800 [Planctomycetes bacterium]|nr:hypothetical protein [Planctomycetota bacterium]
MSSFIVDTSVVESRNRQFWRAIGYDFLFKSTHEPEGQYLLDRCAKKGTVKYLRSHFTFNNSDASADGKAGGNVCGRVIKINADSSVKYDFSHVNKTFREYVKRGMKPIVEFDFFPDGMCYTAEETANDEGFAAVSGIIKDWALWEDLLNKFMINLEENFGKDELKTWYFEVWNEPDWMSGDLLEQFYRMYDVFAHTVKSYDADYKVGGPACYKLYVMKEFLDHVVHGTNHVTGETGSPVDFLSFHIYGLSGAWLAEGPEITPQVSKFSGDMLWWQRLLKGYPSLKGVEIHLNEWGVCSNGDTRFATEYPQLEYRNSEFSALFLVKLVDCLKTIEKAYDFRTELMLYWGSCFNASLPTMFLGSRDLTTTGNVPKPVLTGWEMLTRLGEDFITVEGPVAGGRHGLLAAKSANGIQLLAYNFNETDDNPGHEEEFKIVLQNLRPGSAWSIDEIRLDQEHHNTYRHWQKLGSPVHPDKEVIDALMEVAEITSDASYRLESESDSLPISLKVQRHGMVLLELKEVVHTEH